MVKSCFYQRRHLCLNDNGKFLIMENTAVYDNRISLKVNSYRVENVTPTIWNKNAPALSISVSEPLKKQLDTELNSWLRIYATNIRQKLKRDSLFVRQITELIEANLSDEEYGITQLCKDFGISRAQLHRNLVAHTGLSASRYIQSIRLRKAIDLLSSSDLNISEVAYEVGFNDPKYFSRLFTKEFKQSPRDFRKKLVA